MSLEVGREKSNKLREGLVENSDASAFKYFLPDNTGFDRYGNRIFSSPTLAYNDQGNLIKATLLVSPEGQRLIRHNPGLIKAIDYSLAERYKRAPLVSDEDADKYCAWTTVCDGYSDMVAARFVKVDRDLQKEQPEILPGVRLSWLGFGVSSIVHLLDISGEKYVIKTPNMSYEMKWENEKWNFVKGTFSNIYQPYTHELLQIQSLSVDLDSVFQEYNVRLSSLLFASSTVSCSKFEQRTEINYDDYGDRGWRSYLKTMFRVVGGLDWAIKQYIREKVKSGNGLWKDIFVDGYFEGDEVVRDEHGARTLRVPNTKNFIELGFNKWVWIDPLYYKSTESNKS